jgi:ABC-type amino acid transport substrate-binding protein
MLISRRHSLRALAGAAACLAAPAWAQADEEGEQFDKIKASGSLKVAVYKDNAPFSSEAKGEVVGLDADIARALVKHMGLGVSFLPFHAGENMDADLRWMVERGHYLGFGPADLMMRVPVDRHLMFANRKVFIFGAYMSERPVLLRDSRKLDEVRQAEDLVGYPLAAEGGAGLTSVLIGHGGGLLRSQVKLYPDAIAAAQAVIQGEAAAAYVTRAHAEVALNQAAGATGHLRLGELAFGHQLAKGWPVGVAIKASNRHLRVAVDEAMGKLQSSGQMLSIFQSHRLTLTT